jgi:hypothetical protein
MPSASRSASKSATTDVSTPVPTLKIPSTSSSEAAMFARTTSWTKT